MLPSSTTPHRDISYRWANTLSCVFPGLSLDRYWIYSRTNCNRFSHIRVKLWRNLNWLCGLIGRYATYTLRCSQPHLDCGFDGWCSNPGRCFGAYVMQTTLLRHHCVKTGSGVNLLSWPLVTEDYVLGDTTAETEFGLYLTCMGSWHIRYFSLTIWRDKYSLTCTWKYTLFCVLRSRHLGVTSSLLNGHVGMSVTTGRSHKLDAITCFSTCLCKGRKSLDKETE